MYLLPGYEEVRRAEQAEAEVQLEKVSDEGESPHMSPPAGTEKNCSSAFVLQRGP